MDFFAWPSAQRPSRTSNDMNSDPTAHALNQVPQFLGRVSANSRSITAPSLSGFFNRLHGTQPSLLHTATNGSQDLEFAFTALESLDESNINRQAELYSRMQGALLVADQKLQRSRSSIMDLQDQNFDNFDPSILDFMKNNFGHPLDMPRRSDGWTVKHLLSLVHFCQNHGGEVPIHPVFVLRVLRDVATLMIPNAHKSVREMEVPERGRLVVVGDTHGQLEDVLWIFHKNGLPSSTCGYLFNGDIADRGRNAIEIFILLYVSMLIYPKQVAINRGNHEDETINMDQHCGGFYEEILAKYGPAIGGRLWLEIVKLYPLLPLATILNKRIFIVHGGLSRQERMLPLLKSITTRRVSLPERPTNPPDTVYIDAVWSDPQDGNGITQSTRGQSLIQFGPDVTNAFLQENGFSLLVRSHQPPRNKQGVSFRHNNQLVTVFSASNYCGWYGNQGGVLIFLPDLKHIVDQHFSPTFETLRQVQILSDDTQLFTPNRRNTNSVMELQAKNNSVLLDPRKLELQRDIKMHMARFIVENKQVLWTYFIDADKTTPFGFIPFETFEDCMSAALPGAPRGWERLGVVDPASGMVNYRRFLDRFQCVINSTKAGVFATSWMETLLGRLYDRLMREDLGWNDLLRKFDSTGTGKVSAADFRRELQEGAVRSSMVGGQLSEEQTSQLLRALAAYSCTESAPIDLANVDVEELLCQLEILYTGCQRAVHMSQRRNPVPLCASVLRNIGRAVCQEHVGTQASNKSLKQFFADADADRSGKLSREEFGVAVDSILVSHPEIISQISGFVRQGEAYVHLINQLYDFADISGDGTINYLEFLHCFQSEAVDASNCLRTCLMEQIATTIYVNKGALLKTLLYFDFDYTQTVPREIFLRVLWSLNASLSSASPPLTSEQVAILVDHATFDENNNVNYAAFLSCFEIIDALEDAAPHH